MGNVNYSDAVNRDAVAQITDHGYPVVEASQRLRVSQRSLYAWKNKFAKTPGSGGDDQAAEVRRLKPELARVIEERDILKKGDRVLRLGCKVRHAVIAEHRPLFSVRAMCRCLRIRPSGFYAWLKNPLNKRARDDARRNRPVRGLWFIHDRSGLRSDASF